MAKKKKILSVVTKSDWGGAQRYVYDLAINLLKERFDVVVAAGGGGILFEKLKSAGIRTVRIPGLQRDVDIFSEVKALFNIVRILRQEQPDILHLSSPKAGALGGLAAFLAKLQAPSSKLHVFSTIHGWPFYEDRPHWQKALIFLGSWFSSLFWDSVILINAADLKSAKRFIPRRKLAFIPNGIAEIDFFEHARSRKFFAERIGKPISEDMILIGAIAELTKNKGMTYLIDAVNQIRFKVSSLKFTVLIMGGGEQKNELEQKIRNCSLTQTIFLLGSISDAARYLKGLDVFVLPSTKEGLPYVMLEAMQAGLPIAASAVGGIPDMLENEKEGLTVRPKNPSELAAALLRLLEDSALRNRLGRSAAGRQQQNFSLRAMIEKTMDLLHNNVRSEMSE